MNVRDIPWTFIILVVFAPHYLVTEYTRRCPEPYERTYRANKICSSIRRPLINYACLLDINYNTTKETCAIVADYAPPGERYVLSGVRTTRSCEPGRYQPFVLWANVSGKCLFTKSLCEEEGQLVASPGSSLSDQTCWCDFRQGYHYITKPKDLCGCVPSVEDCSCYLNRRKHLTLEENLCLKKYAAVSTSQPTEAVSPIDSGNEHKVVYISTFMKIPKKLVLFTTVLIFIIGFFVPFLKLPLRKERRLTVAIDLGTTSSVCAFYETTTDFKIKDIKTTGIQLNNLWETHYRQSIVYKTATCILFDKNMNTLCIGYDAVKEYKDYVFEGVEENYYFVNKFKMELYQSKPKKNMKIKDSIGRSVLALTVFSQMLLKLKEHVLKGLRNKYQDDEITWVLSIPAVWSDQAEDFMRICANEAGMCDDQLITVIESEAASVYIHYLLKEKKLTAPQPGLPKNYLVIDLGGGTDDITAHRITSHGKLKQICKPTGGNNGGKILVDKFLSHFEKIVGEKVMNDFKGAAVYLEFIEEVERMFSSKDQKYCIVPKTSLDTLCNKHTGKTLEELLDESTLHNQVTLTRYRLQIRDRSLLQDIYSKLAKDIVEDINRMLRNTSRKNRSRSRNIDTFILVGGFSKSEMLKNIIEKHFEARQINFFYPPEDAELAVVKGAVLYGINPNYIQQDLETSYVN